MLVIVLGVLAGVGALIFYVSGQIDKSFDSVREIGNVQIESTPGNGGSGSGTGGSGDRSKDYAGAREVFREMNAHGARCKRFDSAADTEIVSAGICFDGLEAWTIQVFFTDISYNAVLNGYLDNDAVEAAYGGNWIVLTQSRKSAKAIAKALDGRIT